jgi:hypothetical protein
MAFGGLHVLPERDAVDTGLTQICMLWQTHHATNAPFIVWITSGSVSPKPNMIDDLVTMDGRDFLALCGQLMHVNKQHNLTKNSEGLLVVGPTVTNVSAQNDVIIISLSYFCRLSTVSTLWAYTSTPDATTVSTQLRSPRKSGVSVSTSTFWSLVRHF